MLNILIQVHEYTLIEQFLHEHNGLVPTRNQSTPKKQAQTLFDVGAIANYIATAIDITN